jgi:hypothetical protein
MKHFMTESIELIVIVLVLLVFSFLILSLAWWIILWSFNFPIIFAWKQVIGIFTIVLLLKPPTVTKEV